MATDSLKIGILHPGRMGSSVGVVLAEQGHDVMWASEGRSEETTQRAVDGGLRDVKTLVQVANEADIIFSICVQTAAYANLDHMEYTDFSGIYVDANFIDEHHVDGFNTAAAGKRFSYVDGCIYGYPIPGPEGFTDERTLYLYGDEAQSVADLFDGTLFEGMVLDESAKIFRARRMEGETAPVDDGNDDSTDSTD
ncbi:MAG TPA: hypothetical protein EYQ50_13995 [Verrucomicrobiales bacterium]|nr:hypothetical protein [Verrucomicrobiales bacterium]